MIKPLFIGKKQIELPIIQGGMGVGISLSGLAAAVANEGGIGVISCAGLGFLYKQSPANYLKDCIWGLKEELRKVREKTNGAIGVNIMVALSNFADMVRTTIAEKADFIFAGAGLPLDLPSYLTSESKTLLVPIVSSARAAKIICAKWYSDYNYLPDAIVVEGPKAGGHLGFKKEQIFDESYSLERIIPDVLKITKSYDDIKDIPVIAAGGIYTGSDIYRFISMGVSGVQLGSIFVTTHECDASNTFKQVYINAEKDDLVIISSPVGMPGRAVKNDFLNRVSRGETEPKSCPVHCIKTCDYTQSPYCIMMALYNAYKGNLENGYAFAGANAYLSDKIRSVKDVVSTLILEYNSFENESLKAPEQQTQTLKSVRI